MTKPELPEDTSDGPPTKNRWLKWALNKVTYWITIVVAAWAGSYFTAQQTAEEAAAPLRDRIVHQEAQDVVRQAEALFRQRLMEEYLRRAAETRSTEVTSLGEDTLSRIVADVRVAMDPTMVAAVPLSIDSTTQSQAQEDFEIERTKAVTQRLEEWTAGAHELNSQVQQQAQQQVQMQEQWQEQDPGMFEELPMEDDDDDYQDQDQEQQPQD